MALRLFFLFGFLFPFVAYSQIISDGIPLLDNYSREHYRANNDNWSIEQNDQGVMYFGNSAGILEFDGNHWKNIAPGTFVYDMHKSNEGVIYASMDNDFGYIGYNFKGEAEYFSLLVQNKPTNDYVGTFYSVISVSDTVLFLSNRGYLFKWFNNELTLQKFPTKEYGRYKTIRYINNRYLLQTPDGLAKLENDSLRLVPEGEFFKDKSIEEIFVKGKDTCLIVTRLNGLFELTKSGFTALNSEGSDFLKDNQVYVGTEIDTNSFAFGTIQNGVLAVDSQGKILYNVNRSGGLQSNDHCEIFKDRNNNIWSALENGISSIYSSSPFTQFNEHYGIPMSKVYGILIRKNHFYVGTAQGAYYLNTENQLSKKFQFIEKPGVRKVLDMLEIDDEFIISTSGTGTFIVEGNSAKQISEYTFKKLVRLDERHIVGPLFYGGIGVLQKNNNNWVLLQRFHNYPSMEDLTIDKNGSLWVIEDQMRILNFELSSNKDSLKQLLAIDEIGRISNFDSVSIFKNDDEVLLGTVNGTFRIHNKKIVPYQFFNDALGANVHIKTLKTDVHGNSWFLGDVNNSVIIGKLKQENNQLTIEDYVAPLHRLSDYLIGVFYPYDDEHIFIGTSERIINFNSTLSHLTQKDFSIRISSVVQTKPQDSILFGGTFLHENKVVSDQPMEQVPSLLFKNNAIRISYSALFYENIQNVKYQYRLEGYDLEWSDWSVNTSKEYNYLPEGKYNFIVRAKNVYGVLSPVKSFAFEIKAPWYRTLFAFIGYFLVLVLMVYFIVDYSKRRLVSENVRLEKMVLSRTDEVMLQKQEIEGQNLRLLAQNEEISMQAEQLNELNQLKDRLFSIISHDLRSPILSLFTLLSMAKDRIVSEERFWIEIEKLSKRVGHTRELTENLLNWAHSQMEGFAAKPSSFDIGDLVESKIDFVKELASEKGIAIKSKVSSELLVFADKDMIDLVIRNLIANAIKFCEEGDEIICSSMLQGRLVKIQIEDNGIGITDKNKSKLFGKETFSTLGTKREKGSGLGLLLCKDFVELNGGEIGVKSSEGQGSTFFFTIPVKQ